MSDYAFRQQYLTHSILGYSANPSVDPNAPAIVGPLRQLKQRVCHPELRETSTIAKKSPENETESDRKPRSGGGRRPRTLDRGVLGG